MIIKLFSGGPLWGFRFQFDEINRLVTVNEVEPYSEAFEKGLRIGDQIISINGKRYSKLIDFCNELYNSCNYLQLEIKNYKLPYNQLLSVEIPKKQTYFEPILPSNSTISSSSSDMEILKHLSALKSTLRQNSFFDSEPKTDISSEKITSDLSNASIWDDKSSLDKSNDFFEIDEKKESQNKGNANHYNDGSERNDNGIENRDDVDNITFNIDKDNQHRSNNRDFKNSTTFGINNNIIPFAKETPSNFILNSNMDNSTATNNIPLPPPPMPTNKIKYSESKDWKIPFEVSNVGKAEGIVEVPAKQSVSNLKKQITSKLQMKTPTGAVVLEPPKVHTKCLVSEGFKCLDDDTSSNNLNNNVEKRSRSLTPISYINNFNNSMHSSLGKYSGSISNFPDETERQCKIKKLRGELTSPSIQKAKLYDSTYSLGGDENYQENEPSSVSENHLYNANIIPFTKSNDNLSTSSHKSAYDNNISSNIELSYKELNNPTLSKDNSKINTKQINFDHVNQENTVECNEEREKYFYQTKNFNISPISYNTYTNCFDNNNNNTNLPSSNTFKNEQFIFNNDSTTSFGKQPDLEMSFNSEISNDQNPMYKSYDSSRLSQLINQTNSYINNLNNFDLPPNSRSLSAVPFASSFCKNLDNHSCTENMSSQNYSTTRINNEPKTNTSSTWYKNMYKKLHKIDGEEESVLKYQQLREKSPALTPQRAYTPSISGRKIENNNSDAKYIGLQRSKSATRFQPTYTTIVYDNLSNQNINGQLNNPKFNLSHSRVSLTQNSIIDSKEPLDILQNSNQILSRGINELKKQQMNDIIQQQKAEKLSEELNQNQNRRHGYTPSATPSLQNNFDRFDCLMKTFNPTPLSGKMIYQNDYKTATAIFDFNGKSNRELSLNKGDVVKIYKIIDDNWTEGERNGKIGIFPTSYIKMNESATQQNQQKLISIYPFFARNKNELSIKLNEIVTKTRDIDENWIEGINQHGVVGIFPSNYVKQYNENIGNENDFQYINNSKNSDHFQTSGIAPDRPKTPKFMASLISQPQPQIAHMTRVNDMEKIIKSTQTPVKKQINFTPKIYEWKERHEREGWNGFAKMVPRNSIIYRAIYPYKAQGDGELDLEVNDIIFIVEMLPDDFAVGLLLRNGEFGAVPIEKIIKH